MPMKVSYVNVADPSGRHRFSELDALRGLAALQVVLFHFTEMWIKGRKLPSHVSTTLHLLGPLYTGPEAVTLFFVMSGFVLALPYLRHKQQTYSVYLIRRTLRIYGPYLGALALALIGVTVFHSRPAIGNFDQPSWYRPVQLEPLLNHLIFVAGGYNPSEYDFVIWSLVEEMRISIIFPLLIMCVLRFGGKWSLAVGTIISLLAFQKSHWNGSIIMALHWMTFFILGILLAKNLANLSYWWKKASKLRRWALFVLSLTFYLEDGKIVACLQFYSRRVPGAYLSNWLANATASWITALGACGIIILSLNAPPVRRFLKTSPTQFLGRTSYSLYLVHPIVLLALARSFGTTLTLLQQFLLYVPGSVLVAWGFCVVVEERFIAWGRSVGGGRHRNAAETLTATP